MDIAEQELRKNVIGLFIFIIKKIYILFIDVTLRKLNSLLELSLRTSIAVSDPFKDDITCELLPYNLLHQLLKIIHVADGAVHINIINKEKINDGNRKLTGNLLIYKKYH